MEISKEDFYKLCENPRVMSYLKDMFGEQHPKTLSDLLPEGYEIVWDRNLRIGEGWKFLVPHKVNDIFKDVEPSLLNTSQFFPYIYCRPIQPEPNEPPLKLTHKERFELALQMAISGDYSFKTALSFTIAFEKHYNEHFAQST